MTRKYQLFLFKKPLNLFRTLQVLSMDTLKKKKIKSDPMQGGFAGKHRPK